jgi:predicted dehydrogenase
MSALNVAVWGIGPHAERNILPALAASPGIRLHGICSRNPEVTARVREQFRCEVWSEPAPMLAAPDVDVVYVSTPTGLHAAHGQAVLRAGKHLWGEKPLVENSQQASSLVELSRERRVTVTEGFMFLYHPQFDRIRYLMGSERLGRVQTIACRFGIPPLEQPGFRSDPALGGGAFLDLGSYMIATSVALFPDTEPEIVSAEILTAPDSRVDTGGRAMLRYPGDVTVLLEWRINCAYRNEIDLWGTAGSVTSDRIFSKPADHVPLFRFRDLRGREQSEEGRPENHFVSMLAAFRALIEDPVGAEDHRQLIVRRARLLDRVRAHSKAGAF